MDASDSTNAPPARERISRFCALLGRAEREVRRALATPLAQAALTVDEFFLLVACDGPALPGQTELAAAVALSAAQTSNLLDRLRQRNWLTPERDPVDRRRQVWTLTPEGHKGLFAAWQALEPELDHLEGRLTPIAWRTLEASLQELAKPRPTERRRCA